MILASIQVSFLALGVIFLVLTILIGVINLLNYLIPYQAPPVSPQKAGSTGTSSPKEEEHLAAIQVALAHHLGRPPQSIPITKIQAR